MMNYNANASARQPGNVRKPKRVSDVNAVGPTAPMGGTTYMTPQYTPMPQQQNYQPPQTSSGPMPMGSGNIPSQFNNSPGYGFNPNVAGQDFNQYGPYTGGMPPQQQMPQPQLSGGGPSVPPQFGMFQQPIVQDMAMQYGQKLADQGKELVNKEFEKYIPVTRLKYYFAVDNKYVINKLRLLFFPFTHTDWSLKYDQDSPVQPRYDINAPDLYIPTMAYITYVVLAGLVLGMQNRFSPEQLGIQASSAMAYSIFELIIYSVTLYVANVPTTLKTLDLLAFSGYKYAIIVVCLLISIVFRTSGYYIALFYCSLSLGFFLLRTIKAKVLSEPADTSPISNTYDPYGNAPQSNFDYKVGHKRKLYFLFLVAGLQPVLSFWLSWHLVPSNPEINAGGAL